MVFKLKRVIFQVEEVLLITIIVIALSPTIRSFLDGYITCYFFILFHEASHILIASILDKKVRSVKFKLCGVNAILEKNNNIDCKWILIFLAGPLSNLILALLFMNVKFVFEINVALAVINLVPIKPLDGYNILNIILNWYLNKNITRNILKIIRFIIIFGLLFLGVINLIYNQNPSILILIIYIICCK